MARGPFLIPSILWHRAWGTLPQVGAVEEGVAAQADRLILGLNLAGYEVTQILLGVGADASMDGFGLELESRRSIEFTSWAAETGEAWPPNALAALGLRVVPRTLLEDMVAVFALDLTTTGLVAGVTFDAEQEGWLTIVVPALDELIESALEAFPVAEEPVLQALAQDLANEWDASTPEPPAQPNPVSAGLLWIYDPTHWRYTSRAGATPWEALVDAAAWAWTQADTLSAKQSWLEAVLLGQEPTLLDRLETYSLEAGGEAGSVVAEQLTQVASLQYVALAGPLSDGDSVLFEDLLLLPYTVGLLLLQDLFLINFLGAVDTFVANNEWTEPDLTGFYERDDGGGYDTLQLNQAGRFLEGDWQERITVVDQEFRVRSFVGYSFSASSLAASPLQFQFARSTDVVVGWHLNETQPGTFELEPIAGSRLDEGTLVVTPGEYPVLTITLGGVSTRFRRVARRVRLSEESLAGVPTAVAAKLRSAERYPLHSAEVAEVGSLVEALLGDLKTYYEIVTSNLDPASGPTRIAGARALDDAFVVALQQTFPLAMGSLSPSTDDPMFGEQTEQIRQVAKLMLSASQVDVDPAPPNGWVALTEPTTVMANQTPALRAFFGITATLNSSQDPVPVHTYKWEMGGLGLSGEILIGGSYHRGNMKLIKLSGEPAFAKRQWYDMNVKGWSAGAGVAIHFLFQGGWNQLETPVHWAPENFVGLFEMSAAYGHWAFGGGVSVGASVTQFFGDGTYWPVDSTDFVDYTTLAGYGIGAEGSYQWGELWFGKDGPVDEIETPIDYHVITSSGDSGLVLFGTDEASLSPGARQYVREVCTRHRAVFGSPQTRLVIEGFASTTGSADHNLNLSQRRAAAVYQAIRDHLGDDLRIPWRNTEVRGLGEVPASPGGDDQESPEWRKVTISLDGVVVLDLGGVATP